MKNGTKLQNYSQIQRWKAMISSLEPLVSNNLAGPRENRIFLHLNCLLVTVLTSQMGPGN